jgi:hypothetical protein
LPLRPDTVPPTVNSEAVTLLEVSVLLTPPLHAASNKLATNVQANPMTL